MSHLRKHLEEHALVNYFDVVPVIQEDGSMGFVPVCKICKQAVVLTARKRGRPRKE